MINLPKAGNPEPPLSMARNPEKGKGIREGGDT
jgi:hypothetical protein